MAQRVLILRPNVATIGGVEHYYNVLALDHIDPRFEYFFVTPAGPESIPAVAKRLLGLYLKFWRVLGRDKYALVLLNPSLNRNSFYRDATFCWLATLRGCRVAVFYRGWSEDMERRIVANRLPRFVFRHSYARVRDIIVLSESFRVRLLRMGSDSTARFSMASTVADDAFLAEFDLQRRLQSPSPIRILFMSRLIAAKGASIAVRAFAMARRCRPDLPMELTIAGDGPERGLLSDLVQRERIADVAFTGTAVGDAKKALLLNNDVFLFPTWHGEGMPNVVLEAMLYGMPVLSRPVGGISDVVEHGVNGFLTESLDPSTFCDLIIALTSDNELRRRMSTANHQKALSTFVPARVRAQLIRIIDEHLRS